MTARAPLSPIGQPVPELPIADVERVQQYYRDVLGFDIGWLDPSKEIGAVSRGDILSQAPAAIRVGGPLNFRW